MRVKGPQSLNMIVRKRETERIERENHAFAKRLFDKQAVLNKKNLDTEYHNHIKFKKLIQKMPPPLKSRLIITSDMRRSDPGSNIGDQIRYVEQVNPVKEEPTVDQEGSEQDQVQNQENTASVAAPEEPKAETPAAATEGNKVETTEGKAD